MSPTLSSSVWKYDENIIVIEFLYFQMDKTI